MAYEIEITVGNRTYHYGSLAAYREDMQRRDDLVKGLYTAALRDGVTYLRRCYLQSMAHEAKTELDSISKAANALNAANYS